jgi:hypothetical protein
VSPAKIRRAGRRAPPVSGRAPLGAARGPLWPSDRGSMALIKRRRTPSSGPPLLTVKFRQPIHEFTFGVGMSFLSYPLLLTPLI